MKKSMKLIKKLSIASLITLGCITFSNNNTNSVINENNQPTIVKAATNSSITLPKGYTAKRILQVNNNKISKKNKAALIAASKTGIKTNTFYGDESDKNKIVDVTNLTQSQKLEINRYALKLINSARSKMGKKPWILNKSAMQFADRVAKEYHDNNKSVWDPDHYVAGITRAAVASGLKNAGQVYEDESGLPITSEFHGTTRSMYALKEQIYFNVKQMLFGGFYGREADYNNSSYYTEWEHAGDLLGLRSLKNYDAAYKYFGLSFSDLPSDHSKISVHFIGVAKQYISNSKKFSTKSNL
ncbi:SEC10/PgrA surface exclusion domain-containing protein [Lactobacillus sp.]|uniref:SEC10/PgrA surface exclusion domain-containing protein n=1 Tax=Lactobacillus sp. TaxID=1591 RepID=UPI0019CB2542|nr:SEC10/PgrA surface exclusion domain-containing protein [Lactobacillus sp.]MBD5429287.1 SEC10/PgrA surface exclusion domain-containing protein [Lactobacillus sp.]